MILYHKKNKKHNFSQKKLKKCYNYKGDNMNLEKINKCEKKIYMLITTIALYLFISIFKNIYFGLYTIKFSELTQKEQLIGTLVYQIFAIAISILFLVKNKNKTLEEFKKYLKIAGIGIATIIIYSSTSLIELGILYYSKIDVSKMSILAKSIYLILCETLIITIIAIINKQKLKENFKDIKKNYNQYFTKYLKLYALALLIMIISNIFINNLTKTIPGNEETIRQTITKAPLYMFFSAVFFAPFTEEMVFRNSIKNIINSKYAFIITSGLIFGGLHVIGNINTLYDLLYIIPYSTPGIAFAYMLYKTDNIFVPMGIHFLHNGLLMTLQIILLFLH